MEESNAKEILRELDDGWHLNSDGHLERVYVSRTSCKLCPLPTKCGDAEDEGHHPDFNWVGKARWRSG